MLTLSSLLIGLFVAGFIWHDPVGQALFRFPTSSLSFPLDQYYLLIPIVTAAFAWFIFRKVAARPGPVYPRWYALGLALVCTGIAIFGLVDRIVYKSYRGTPSVHGASAAALMAVLVLAIRLVRIHPYSKLVQYVAPIALVILLVGLVGANSVANYMIREETARVKASADKLHDLADQIRKASEYNWSSLADKPDAATRQVEKLKVIALRPSLPDEWVWKAAGILNVRDQLITAAGDLTAAVSDSLTKVQGPRITGTEYVADQQRRFTEKGDFKKPAAIALEYYTQIRKLMLELESGLPTSPAGEAYLTDRREYTDAVKRFRNSFSGAWLASAAGIEDSDPLTPAEIAELKADSTPLAAFESWKAMPWKTVHSWRGQSGPETPVCGQDPLEYDGPAPPILVKPDPDDAKTWFNRPRRYQYSRFDCYSYQNLGDGPATVAQMQLLYRSEPDGRSFRLPLEVDLYWKQAGGKPDPGDLMKSLAGAVKSIYNVAPRSLSGSDSISRGFRVSTSGRSSFEVSQPKPADGPAGGNLLHIAIR
jgi:hypothetical protein